MRRPAMKPLSERNPVIVAIVGLAVLAVIGLVTFDSANLPIIGGGTGYTAYFAEDAGLLQVARAPLHGDIVQLGRLATNLDNNSGAVNSFLHTLPVKMAEIGKLASYGGWLNFFMCEALVSGVTEKFGPNPTGVPVTAARCR